MTRRSPLLAFALGLALAAPASASPPAIKSISPFGVKRGEPAEVAIHGGNLSGHPKLIAPFAFTIDPATAETKDAGVWKPKLTVAPETPIGVYTVRVQTDDGLSNPFLFAVGQLPQVAEKEDNNTFETAQAITTPVVVEGQAAGNDVDFFKFNGRQGERIVVDAQCARVGSGVDPTIRLTTVDHQFVAAADDSPGLLTDARLFAVLPADGDYVVELSDTRYQGGNHPIYRLLVGAVPVAAEVFPMGGRLGETIGFELRGGTLPGLKIAAMTMPSSVPDGPTFLHINNHVLGLVGPSDPVLDLESVESLAVGTLPELREPTDPSAPPIKAIAPVVFNGRIDPEGDEDRYVLAVTPGQRLRMKIHASLFGSALDGQLQVLNAQGNVLANADDSNLPPMIRRRNNQQVPPVITPDPALDFTVPGGQSEITLVIRDLESRGGIGFPYRLTVEPVTPSFSLRLDDAEVSIPKGGTKAIDVAITRQGYNGPITLNVLDPPPGLTIRPGAVAEGQNTGVLTVSAAPDASFAATVLKVVGQAKGSDGPIVQPAEVPIVFAQQGNMPIHFRTQIGLAAAPAQALALALDAPSEPIEVVHGFGAPVTIKVNRKEGAEGGLELAPLVPLPKGITVPNVKTDEKAAETTVTINAAPEAPLGPTTLALIAKGKVHGKDQTFATPAVTVNIVRPAVVDLASAQIEVKAGTPFELKGKLVRKGPFQEPVTIRLNGLPGGLKAEPVTVAPDASDFTLKIIADPKVAAASANANVTLAFQINKKDYSTPPSPLTVKVVPAQ
jgi:hypothetical protein